jgi:predicted transcriptional regulator
MTIRYNQSIEVLTKIFWPMRRVLNAINDSSGTLTTNTIASNLKMPAYAVHVELEHMRKYNLIHQTNKCLTLSDLGRDVLEKVSSGEQA